MKRIFITLCAIALVIAGDVPLSAEAATDTSYSPSFVEEYNYGDFDELGINKTYQLSPSDDPRLITTEDFELGGRRYFLLDLIRTDEACAVSEDGCSTVTYTAVFGSEKLPGKAKSRDTIEYYLHGKGVSAKSSQSILPTPTRTLLWAFFSIPV